MRVHTSYIHTYEHTYIRDWLVVGWEVKNRKESKGLLRMLPLIEMGKTLRGPSLGEKTKSSILDMSNIR